MPGGFIAYTADVCPGFLIAQPCVAEANEAAAVPEGEIGEYYPERETTIMQARLVAKSAQNLAQIYRLKKKDSK